MHLDLMTMSAVDITLTGILAAVLLFTWARDAREPEGGPRFVGWWGLAMLIQSMGVVIALAAALQNNDDLVTIGTATMVLADAVKWSSPAAGPIPCGSSWVPSGSFSWRIRD
jgi:LytS/YehU family sensor histidine kinase